MMHGLTRMRLLGGLLLAAVITVASGDPSAAFGQKSTAKPDYHSDPSKKLALVKPTLPEGAKLSAADLAKHIDKLVLARLKAEQVEPSPRSSDEEFLRRAYLDITGKIPTSEKALAFLDSKEENKRAKLIDELLASSDYGRHQADIWQRLLLPRDSDNRRLLQYYPHLVTWLEEKFNKNITWDVMTKDIITATGAVEKNGPVIYWVANNSADKMTDNVSRMFLGIQLQCAQCHNHPFTDWKQEEYWGMASFFLNVRPSGNPKAAAKTGDSFGIVENANAKRGKKMNLPESAKILPPKFLQGDRANLKPSEARRPALAAWMASAKNPFFGKAMVNRVWGQMFGRGIVNPVDDMHAANAPSHPELLADLEHQFAATGFDVKHLIRAICNSEAYQRSSRPKGSNADVGPELFARMAVKPLSPEQMYDALAALTGGGRGAMAKNRVAMKGNAGGPREAFVNFFAAEDGADPTEYHTGIPQVLRLMNSPQFNNGALATLARSGLAKEEIVEKMFLAVLARRPTSEEKDRIAGHLSKAKDHREGMAGVLWALMNSSEFAMNR